MIDFNHNVLSNITGTHGILEVINSGSVFELPEQTIKEILQIAKQKKISIIYFEIYYGYMKKLAQLREMFSDIEIRFKMGLETFDNNYRNNTYNKRFTIQENEYPEISKQVHSICLMICTKGQTKEMIANDIALGLKHFRHITLNVFVNNGTTIERDPSLVEWFCSNYQHLFNHPQVEALLNNHELGVFEQ